MAKTSAPKQHISSSEDGAQSDSMSNRGEEKTIPFLKWVFQKRIFSAALFVALVFQEYVSYRSIWSNGSWVSGD